MASLLTADFSKSNFPLLRFKPTPLLAHDTLAHTIVGASQVNVSFMFIVAAAASNDLHRLNFVTCFRHNFTNSTQLQVFVLWMEMTK
jgi:hypothetical protein